MEDNYGREINYLRLSITDRCNFRCLYCMPKEGIKKLPKNEILSFESMVKLVKAAVKLGFKNVRFTGGEPLIRRDMPKLIGAVNDIDGIKDLSMTTNGSLLSGLAKELKLSGLDRINISLDALTPDKFREITRGGDLHSVLSGIQAAKSVGLNPIKLNAVVIKDVNESEVLPLVDFAVEEGLILRFIELMPMGEAAKSSLKRVDLDKIKKLIKKRWKLVRTSGPKGNGPASYYHVARKGKNGMLGFIFPISKNFCDSCNKIRVTSQGKVRPCLACDKEYELEINKRTSINSLSSQLAEIIKRKPYGHQWDVISSTKGEMSKIGG